MLATGLSDCPLGRLQTFRLPVSSKTSHIANVGEGDGVALCWTKASH